MNKGFEINEVGINFQLNSIKNLKIAHISDLHNSFFGQSNIDLAAKINEFEPDIIAFSGDMIHHIPAAPVPFIELLKFITVKCPMYMCLGNHEIRYRKLNREGYNEIMSQAASLGVRLLDDEHERININGTDIDVYGLATAASGYGSSVKSITKRIGRCDSSVFSIVLAHSPAWFDSLAEWGADLVLSGHVHGGIIKLPVLGGLLSPECRILPKYDSGLFEYNNSSKMYLSSGLGGALDSLRYKNPHELALLYVNCSSGPREKVRKRVASDIKISLKILLTFIMILTIIFSCIPMSLGYANRGIVVNLILSIFGIVSIYPPKFIVNSRIFAMKELLFILRIAVIIAYLISTIILIIPR